MHARVRACMQMCACMQRRAICVGLVGLGACLGGVHGRHVLEGRQRQRQRRVQLVRTRLDAVLLSHTQCQVIQVSCEEACGSGHVGAEVVFVVVIRNESSTHLDPEDAL